MPDYKTHLKLGFLTAIVAIIAYIHLTKIDIPPLNTLGLLAVLVGHNALFPDIDSQSSKIHYVYNTIIIVAVVAALLSHSLFSDRIIIERVGFSILGGFTASLLFRALLPPHRGSNRIFPSFHGIIMLFLVVATELTILLYSGFIAQTELPLFAIALSVSYASHTVSDMV